MRASVRNAIRTQRCRREEQIDSVSEAEFIVRCPGELFFRPNSNGLGERPGQILRSNQYLKYV
jgi:hypothetical protein